MLYEIFNDTVKKNYRYFILLQHRKRKLKQQSTWSLSILKRGTSTLTVLFSRNIFTSYSKWKSKTTFILVNCRNSNISKTIEKFVLITRSIMVLKIEISSLRQPLNLT